MNVFELFAKISLDTGDYERNLEQAGEKTESFGSKVASGLGSVAKIGYDEILHPKPIDTRTAEEIAADVLKGAGLKLV